MPATISVSPPAWSDSAAAPALLTVTWLSVSEAGTSRNVLSPLSNTTVPPLGAKVPPVCVRFRANEVVVEEARNVPPERVKVLLKSIKPLPPVNVAAACV